MIAVLLQLLYYRKLSYLMILKPLKPPFVNDSVSRDSKQQLFFIQILETGSRVRILNHEVGK